MVEDHVERQGKTTPNLAIGLETIGLVQVPKETTRDEQPCEYAKCEALPGIASFSYFLVG